MVCGLDQPGSQPFNYSQRMQQGLHGDGWLRCMERLLPMIHQTGHSMYHYS